MSQYDLPPQTLLQQSSARPVSGEELETYGKHAASIYERGACSLNDAVVETVKKAGLAPEQVRRVVEFANTHAFLNEFKKEGVANKYVVFDGGPAEFNTVLQDLNDGGGGTVFDYGDLDYSHAPETSAKTSSARLGMLKTASAERHADSILEEAFRVEQKAPPLPFNNPLQEVYEMKDKLSAARDFFTSSLNELEVDLLCISEDLYQHVKQAALQNGDHLGVVVQAWHEALDADPQLVKAAFAFIGPRLVDEQVFTSWDSLGASIEKTAGARLVVNQEHPIVAAFDAYSTTVTKLAHIREAQKEVLQNLQRLESFERNVNVHFGEVVR